MVPEAGPKTVGEIGEILGDDTSFGTPGTLPDLVDPWKVLRAKPTLPGHEGLPFRGKAVPNIKRDDPDALQPQIGMEVGVEIFDMSNAEHKKAYTDIMQLVANGYAQVSFEEKVYDSEIKNWRIFLRYVHLFSHMSSRAQ